MKKLLSLIMVVVMMTGCVSSGMKISSDPITGDSIRYGYSWTTGSEEIQDKWGIDHSLSSTLIYNEVKGKYVLDLSLVLIEEISVVNTLLTTDLNKVSDTLNARSKYTKELKKFRIIAGEEEVSFVNYGGTIKNISTIGSNMGTSSFKAEITKTELKNLNSIYSQERVILAAIDKDGEEYIALVNAKEGMLELLEYIKTKSGA